MTPAQVLRVVVTGSESTGKTMLARDLADHFGVLWVPEQSRVYAGRVNRPLGADDVSPIASAQIAAEDAALVEAQRRGDRLLFLDTDLLSTVVYARHYYRACPQWIEAETRARRGDLYLVAAIDLPWVPDGIRDRPIHREELNREFRGALAEFQMPSCAVHGFGAERLSMAIRCIDAHQRAAISE
jgi:NadR type nicotinamide-nucleotide adenylyltransferase